MAAKGLRSKSIFRNLAASVVERITHTADEKRDKKVAITDTVQMLVLIARKVISRGTKETAVDLKT